jgi:hypothetical protein
MKSYHSQVNGWNWRTSSQVKLVRFRRPKIACSPSYADYRPKKCSNIIGHWSHQGETTNERGSAKEGNQNLECG